MADKIVSLHGHVPEGMPDAAMIEMLQRALDDALCGDLIGVVLGGVKLDGQVIMSWCGNGRATTTLLTGIIEQVKLRMNAESPMLARPD
jgi:hypothetical protein